ncbi:MAG TPA: DUF899 domain-containing protein [Fimbriimonadaceae bacterium]|jgi:predicted dithiol-disulfide oxidoreductase (DUF899 family)
MSQIPHPPIASREEWRKVRLQILEHEKELTRQKDKVSAERRRLPMVPIDKDYSFEGPEGKVSLVDLFQGLPQLIVYHFMFDPEWEDGCPGCTSFVNAQGKDTELKERSTRFILISRAPLPKLQKYAAKMGWDMPWYSSFGSDFNYDFNATHDRSHAGSEFLYIDHSNGEKKGTEEHGLSVFFLLDGKAYHVYSTFARGVENLTDSYALLDVTPYGRQEDWEDSPEGWPQNPTYG